MDLADDPEFQDQFVTENWPAQTTRLGAIIAQQPVAYWADLFAGSDACVAPVLSPQSAANEPHMLARGIWKETHGALQPAPAPRFDDGIKPIAAAPKRGRDSNEIYTELKNAGLV